MSGSIYCLCIWQRPQCTMPMFIIRSKTWDGGHRRTGPTKFLWSCRILKFTLFTLKGKKRKGSHQILDPVVIKVSAALREPIQQDFDETLVPRWTHGEETVLQHTTVLVNVSLQLMVKFLFSFQSSERWVSIHTLFILASLCVLDQILQHTFSCFSYLSTFSPTNHCSPP